MHMLMHCLLATKELLLLKESDVTAKWWLMPTLPSCARHTYAGRNLLHAQPVPNANSWVLIQGQASHTGVTHVLRRCSLPNPHVLQPHQR